MRKAFGIGVKLALWLFLGLQASSAFAAIWQDATISAKSAAGDGVYYRALKADQAALQQALAAAPLEYTSSEGAELLLPMPDGSMQRFEVENSPIMAPELADRYPEIQTYRVRGLDDPTATGRLDFTPVGFHAMVSSPAGTFLIDPDQTGGYLSYYWRDYVAVAKGLNDHSGRSSCLVESASDEQVAARPVMETALRTSGGIKRYQLAIAATGEYTIYQHNLLNLADPTTSAFTAITTAINRVNEIYARDLAIEFLLIDNSNIIYTDPNTDPYTNDNGLLMLDENQATLDAVIGSANYDMGHVFSTGGGGIAIVGGVCRADFKAMGVTGMPQPTGDVFYIDLVAHEMGHQLAAQHSFNGTTGSCNGNRVAASAVEPGSGSTIMAYAGICHDPSSPSISEDLQDHSDATFHAKSTQEILAYTQSVSDTSCGSFDVIANSAPQVDAGANYVIPLCTAFALQGTATDDDLDTLVYQWDEMDLGVETDANTFGTDLGSNPLFRSYLPRESGERVFPRISALAYGTTDKGEVLPAAARTMHFSLTARDGSGGVSEDNMTVTVDAGMGPFQVSGGLLNSGGVFLAGGLQTIEWTVGNTEVSCPEVSISLVAFSATGESYCDASNDSNLLLDVVENNGTAQLDMPDLNIPKGRVKIACTNNVFFSLSANDLQLSGTSPVATNCKETDRLVSDGSGDLVEACKSQIGATSATSTIVDGGGGGGGALILLPGLLGFHLARKYRRERCSA